MRVTSEVQSQQSILNVQLAFARMTKYQNQLATGNRIDRPSDDPTAITTILQNNVQDAQLTTDLSSIQNASGVLQASVSAITQVQNVLNVVKNAALQASNSFNQDGTNQALSSQVNAAIDQLLGVANTQQADGTYLFGGTAKDEPPFVVTSSNSGGQATAIAYQGSQENSKVIVGRALTVSTLISGSSVFQPLISGPTEYSGSTGAKAGTSIDTATGRGTLQVTHTLTTFAGASGVTAGTSSASSDTIIGPLGSNSLVINDTSGTGASGTVSLNGGTAVAFSSSDTNLKVTGPSGEVVYINTSAISPGFNGTVSLTADGTLSVDGGATTTPITFNSNQAVTDSTTGATTFVDSTSIHQTGQDLLNHAGQADLFQTLISLRDTIKNTQGLSSTDRSTAITQQIAELDRYATAVAKPLGDQSAQAQFLSTMKTRTTTIQTNVKKQTSDLQSADYPATIAALQQQQMLYQAGLQLTASMNQMSLLNFLH